MVHIGREKFSKPPGAVELGPAINLGSGLTEQNEYFVLQADLALPNSESRLESHNQKKTGAWGAPPIAQPLHTV